MTERRTRDRMLEFVNGEWDQLPPPLRRALTVIADEVDGLHHEHRRLVSKLDDLRKTIIGVGASVVLIVVTAAVGVIFR